VAIDEASYRRMRDEIAHRVAADNVLLEELRTDIRPLALQARRIQPRSVTSLSLVATDGGNNQLRFDPFLVQLVRVVDSNDQELCLEAVSPTTPIAELEARHFGRGGEPLTPLGRMMAALGISRLADLSGTLRADEHGLPRGGSVVQVYRELAEWAVLHDLLRSDYASDTLVVFDGDLRSKMFTGDLFKRLGVLFAEQIERHAQRRRTVFLVGLMKSSSVLARYRLAMALEGVLRGRHPAYVAVPRGLEEKVYRWDENARGRDREEVGREVAKFVIGSLFFVKFGSRPADPVWPVHVFEPQAVQADRIFGHLLADAIEGFPVPLYPRCLQKAHERAALVDFDMDMLQDAVFDGLREVLGARGDLLDAFRLEDADPARGRYR
jgi:hypothetical protein